MTGEFASMRSLSPEMHAGATRLVAEAMASATVRVLSPDGRDEVIARLRATDQRASVTEAFLGQASDFLDIGGDPT